MRCLSCGHTDQPHLDEGGEWTWCWDCFYETQRSGELPSDRANSGLFVFTRACGGFR